jgi:hypothetical protein
MATEATSTEHVPVEVLDVLLDRVEWADDVYNTYKQHAEEVI